MKRTLLTALLAGLLGGCPPPPGEAPLPPGDNSGDSGLETKPSTGVPGAPSRVTPTGEVSGDSVELRWYPVGGARHYSIYAGTTEDPPLVFRVTANTYRLQGLALCATYYWRVEAENDNGVTSSPLWNFRTLCPSDRPDVPAYPAPSNKAYGVPVRDESGAGPALHWKAAHRAEIYEVYFGLTPNPPYFASSYEPRVTNMPELIEKQRYYSRVVARNKSGDTSSQEWSFTATTSAAGPPTPLNVFPPDGTQNLPTLLRLAWTESWGAHSFRVYLGTSPDPPLLATITSSALTTPVELSLNATYYWRVEAAGNAGSTTSPVWKFMTAATPQPPLMPRGPRPATAAAGIPIDVGLSWEPIANATAYDVYLGPGGATQFAGTVTSSSYTPATPLLAGVGYAWQVVARNAVGETRGPLWRFVTDPPDNGGGNGSGSGGGGEDGWGGDGGIAGDCDGVVRRINTSSGDGQSRLGAFLPAISADARFVAFVSLADDLVPGDTNGGLDVFVRDLQTGGITRASVDSSGGQASTNGTSVSISGDGRLVAFETDSALVPQDTNGVTDVYIHDLQTHLTRPLTVTGNRPAGGPALSADGRFAAFHTRTRAVPADTNEHADVYIQDLATGALELISVSSDETPGDADSIVPSVSGDGRFVSFHTQAGNWGNGVPERYGIYVRDRSTGLTHTVGDGIGAVISGNGTFVAYTVLQAYVADLEGNRHLVSRALNGGESNSAAFYTAISYDGSYVAFTSCADDLVSPDTNVNYDVFRYDRNRGEMVRLSDGPGGEANGWSCVAALSGEGAGVAFDCGASNLIADDTNEVYDVFVVCRP